MSTRCRCSSCIIIWLCTLYSASCTLTKGRYSKVRGTFTLAQDSALSVKVRNVIQCSDRCLANKCSCFSYDSILKQCEFGRCTTANSSTETSTQVYVSHIFLCESNDGFKHLTYGSLTACVWMSTQQVNYATALSDCQAKSSHLCTLKSVDKLKLLKRYYGSLNFWVGLDDLEQTGTFRWAEDNTTCDEALVKELFDSGQPDNYLNLQHCVNYRSFRQSLDDDFCYNTYTYICEPNSL